MKQIIQSTGGAAPIGPYSRAVKAGNMIFFSGTIALNEDGNMVQDSLEAETVQVMENIKNLLKDAGISFSHVVKTSIFLSDMAHFAQVNEVYARYFTGDFPARETVAVAGLPKGANVEISVIALAG
jgi:2-iminobutanoate/2-iminopropanoate deaminase